MSTSILKISFSTFARVVLCVVWLFSGFIKLSDTQSMVLATRAFDILPEGLVRPVAFTVPLLELVVGILLLLGVVTRLAGFLSAVLVMSFLIAIGSAWVRGLSIDCGCFGGGGAIASDPTIGYIKDILRDLGLLLLSVWLWFFPRTFFALQKIDKKQPTTDNSTSSRHSDIRDQDKGVL